MVPWTKQNIILGLVWEFRIEKKRMENLSYDKREEKRLLCYLGVLKISRMILDIKVIKYLFKTFLRIK